MYKSHIKNQDIPKITKICKKCLIKDKKKQKNEAYY